LTEIPAGKAKKKKNRDEEKNIGVMNRFDDFTVLRFYGMLNIRNVIFTKEELLKMNL